MPTQLERLQALERLAPKIQIKLVKEIQSALQSSDPTLIIKANDMYSKIQDNAVSDIKTNAGKAFLVDPLNFNNSLGFKEKPYSLTYTTLKRMSRNAPIINSIITTRKNQVADFCEPQIDRYSNGFVIRKKSKIGSSNKMDNRDKKIAAGLTDFILNTGGGGSWNHDDFDSFTRKQMSDSLTYDQMVFEIIRSRRGKIEKFIAADASTFRFAESFYSEDYKSDYFLRNGYNKPENWGKQINGYYPAYVQIYENAKVSSFYPWELCMGIRNPDSSIYSNGYGISELEDLVNVVTSMLYGDEYNRRFFSQGSAPKGFLKVKNVSNEAALQQFKQQWQAMISGVMQSWKTPVLEADAEWVDLQKNNRDMEFVAWNEYLIKLACALYSIDPSEIGFDIARSGGGGLFEGNKEERLKHSKDKGLYPLLKFYQRKLNRSLIEQINPEFELVFMGLNGMTIDQEIDLDVKRVNSFMTINEIRQKWDLPELEDGEMIENAIYASAQQQKALAEQQSQANSSSVNPFDYYNEDEENDEEDNSDEEDSDEEGDEKSETNIFVKAFDEFLNEQ